MQNITRKDIIESISSKTGLTQVKVKTITESFLEAIKESLYTGKDIELRGFGRFKIKQRKARIARNPRTGEKVSVKDGIKPKFEASRKMIKRVNKNKT